MDRQKVGIIMTDGGGGDTYFRVCSEEDYNIIQNYRPTKKWKSMHKDEEEDILDVDAFIRFVSEYFWDPETEESNEKELMWFSTQTFVPEALDFSKYELIGILSMPGG